MRRLGLGALLADDMGLGKTMQVLSVISITVKEDQGKGTDLIIAPASLMHGWKKEAEKWTPGLRVAISHPSYRIIKEEEAENYDLILTTYAMAGRTGWMKSYKWRNLILDEAQAIKAPGSERSKMVRKMRAHWRVAMTGTPIENKIGDIWPIMDFLNPGMFGTLKEFIGHGNKMSKNEDFTPLKRMIEMYRLRRMKTDRSIISDLPDKIEKIVYCNLTKEQAGIYEGYVERLENVMANADGRTKRGKIFGFLTKFRQICNHPSLILNDVNFPPAESGKFLKMIELAKEIDNRDEKLLVFTHFAQIIPPIHDALQNVFGGPGLTISGATSIKKRGQYVQEFQSNPNVKFMVLSAKAAGTGLTLTAANHVIHFDRGWNPATEDQATDRAFRIGQAKNVIVHKFVSKGTIEENIDRMLKSKKDIAGDVVGTGGDDFTKMSNEEIMTMFKYKL